jgi:hypothetical protein
MMHDCPNQVLTLCLIHQLVFIFGAMSSTSSAFVISIIFDKSMAIEKFTVRRVLCLFNHYYINDIIAHKNVGPSTLPSVPRTSIP